MTLNELRAVAKVSQDGWLVSWTPEGYIVSKGVDPTMRLEAARGGVRTFASLDAAARLLREDIRVGSYFVRDRTPGQQQLF